MGALATFGILHVGILYRLGDIVFQRQCGISSSLIQVQQSNTLKINCSQVADLNEKKKTHPYAE